MYLIHVPCLDVYHKLAQHGVRKSLSQLLTLKVSNQWISWVKDPPEVLLAKLSAQSHHLPLHLCLAMSAAAERSTSIESE
jgi:hypothetical protein